MPKLVVCGRGGSGKSTLVALLARRLGEEGKVLVVDADESNPGLGAMLGMALPEKTLLDHLGGKPAVGQRLRAVIQRGGGERLELFPEKLKISSLAPECVRWDGSLALVQVGKIEHAMEGCACPMGVVARSFLKSLELEEGEWVLVDTEAGVEHFGRGVLEGADKVLMVVDPSRDAVALAAKAARLAREAGKECGVVLNRVDGGTEPLLREMVRGEGLDVLAVFPYSSALAKAGLSGRRLEPGELREQVEELVRALRS